MRPIRVAAKLVKSVMAGRAYLGTSGWTYLHWKHSFYENRPAKAWLGYIGERFNTVEVDGTFYRQQKRETFERWAALVPADFRFSIRGHRFITHRKRLLDAPESIKLLRAQAQGLGDKLACVLWQLPPSMRKDTERLRSFAGELRSWSSVWHAIEFRHSSWFDEEVAALLRDCNLVNTISDAGRFPRWDAVTASAVYVRLHAKPHTYWDAFSDEALAEWAERIGVWVRERRDVFVYFDNDANGAAPWNALTLAELLSSRKSPGYLA